MARIVVHLLTGEPVTSTERDVTGDMIREIAAELDNRHLGTLMLTTDVGCVVVPVPSINYVQVIDR